MALLESLPGAFNVIAAHSAMVPAFGVFCAGCAFASDQSCLGETLEFLGSLTGWKDSQSISEAQEMTAHISLATKGLTTAKSKIDRIRLRNQEASEHREAMATIPQSEDPLYEVICTICTMEIEPKDYLPLERCGHFFHPECIKEYLEMEITERKFPLVCPILACKEDIVDLDLRERLSPELFKKCEEYRFNMYVQRNQKEVKHCLTPDCPFVFVMEGRDHNFECPICFKKWCLDCKQESHPMFTCEEYGEIVDPIGFNRLFDRFKPSEGFKQCPQCEVMVEKEDGCDFIQCQCGFKFCFSCGTGFKDCKCGVGFCEKCLADRVHCTCRRGLPGMGRAPWFGPPGGPPRFGPPGAGNFDIFDDRPLAYPQRHGPPGMGPPKFGIPLRRNAPPYVPQHAQRYNKQPPQFIPQPPQYNPPPPQYNPAQYDLRPPQYNPQPPQYQQYNPPPPQYNPPPPQYNPQPPQYNPQPPQYNPQQYPPAGPPLPPYYPPQQFVQYNLPPIGPPPQERRDTELPQILPGGMPRLPRPNETQQQLRGPPPLGRGPPQFAAPPMGPPPQHLTHQQAPPAAPATDPSVHTSI